MKTLRIIALALLVLIGGGYLGRDGLVRMLDQHFYESTLAVCVASMGVRTRPLAHRATVFLQYSHGDSGRRSLRRLT